MPFGWLLFASSSILLDAVAVYYAVRAKSKRTSFVVVVCCVQIMVGCSNALFTYFAGPRNVIYFRAYWTGDLLAHAAVLALVISLIWQALQGQESQRKTTNLLFFGVTCFVIFSAYNFYSPHLNRWMTPLSRNLSFCEEILNLILWSVLIQSKASDFLLLTISAGIGVQVTGEVIGHTLRLYTQSASTVWVPNTLVSLSELVCLAIWIWAFRSAGQSDRKISFG